MLSINLPIPLVGETLEEGSTEADAAQGRAKMDVLEMCQWMYCEDLPDDIGPTMELLERYSGLRRDKIESHLRETVG